MVYFSRSGSFPVKLKPHPAVKEYKESIGKNLWASWVDWMSLRTHHGLAATLIKLEDFFIHAQTSRILPNQANYSIRNKPPSQSLKDLPRQVITTRDLLNDMEPIAISRSNILGPRPRQALCSCRRCHGTTENRQNTTSSAVSRRYWLVRASSDWSKLMAYLSGDEIINWLFLI
jgi:hypothetical protein